jgi:hypothetical protein
MSDWSNGLQLPEEDKPEVADKPMPLHEEKEPNQEARGEHAHSHHSHADKKKIPVLRKKSGRLSQLQVGIGVAAVLVTALALSLAYRSSRDQLGVATGTAQQTPSVVSPTTWVGEDFVMNFTLPSGWEFTYSDTESWIVQYREDGVNGQLEVSLQDSSILDELTGDVSVLFAGTSATYQERSQTILESGSEVRLITAQTAIKSGDKAIRSQFNLQGVPDVLTNEVSAKVLEQFKQILNEATLE